MHTIYDHEHHEWYAIDDDTGERHWMQADEICGECDGGGWRDVKSPDDAPGYDYCTCEIGIRKRHKAHAQRQRERAAENAANLPW